MLAYFYDMKCINCGKLDCVRKAKQAGYHDAKAEVVENLGNTTTREAKSAEAARVRNYRENGKSLPLNKERDKRYKPSN